MAKNDFLTGLLQGLYESGVGNPSIQREERQVALQDAFRQKQLAQQAAASGLEPVRTAQPTGQSFQKGHPIWGMFRKALFPGIGGVDEARQMASIPTAFQMTPGKRTEADLDIQKKQLDIKKTEQEIAMAGQELSKPRATTKAQQAVDREFAKDYSNYVALGGYADTITQISSLSEVFDDLEKKNLTGPALSFVPERFRPTSMAAQQTVEQSVQRSLKLTLGGQFTQKESDMFMRRGYDPRLPEGKNREKLKRAINQLKIMALAKQKAVDYYEENGTLAGYKGEFYMLRNGEMVKASKDDFYKMISSPTALNVGMQSIPTINSQEEYDALSIGAEYYDSMGNKGTKR